MLAKRIIPCLDVKDGQTVKGTNFVNLRQAGDPVELGRAYSEAGAGVAETLSIPFTVGGGIGSVDDVDRMLSAGADKVSVNSAALRRPELIDEIASRFGSQVIVCAIDAKETDGQWETYINGGRIPFGKGLLEWAREAQERGAGEILFTSMNHDGVKAGFANKALAMLSENLSIPVIASGGAGSMEHFRDVFKEGRADAALAASVFHFGEIGVQELKTYLRQEGICVR